MAQLIDVGYPSMFPVTHIKCATLFLFWFACSDVYWKHHIVKLKPSYVFFL